MMDITTGKLVEWLWVERRKSLIKIQRLFVFPLEGKLEN